MNESRPEPDRRLRIAVLHRIFVSSGGGAERYAIALVEHLSQRHEVHVFAQEIGHQSRGVTYHKVSTPLRRPRWINQLWYAFATWRATREGFDIVHSHENTWHGNVQTVHVLPVWHNFFAGRTGVRLLLRQIKAWTSPRMWTYLGLESSRFSVPTTRGGSGVRRLIVVTSEPVRKVMLKTFPKSALALRVLTPGVELPSDSVPNGQLSLTREQARRQLGVPADSPCVLFIGNDFGKKGLPSLLKALAKLPADAVLLAIGSAQRIPAFRTMADDLDLGNRVILQGALKDISIAYRCADVLAHPTLEDTFAMVVLEAMAHGLPVVVSDESYCGIASMLTDGVDAVILPYPKDHGAIANALNAVLGKALYRKALSEKAFEFASHHTWAAKTKVQEAMYFELLDD
ncbi:MAG: glycosyltransferase family 4 protein [Betaproteobacteria bacterium]|nr:glycosyltransferase family 4 protein [Betaproteobacteria bacterium]